MPVNSGALWELHPVEIRTNAAPPILGNSINVTEQQVFAEEGVDIALFQKYLLHNNNIKLGDLVAEFN